MAILSMFVSLPVTVLVFGFCYNFLKLKKQDVNIVKQILYRNNSPLVMAHRAGQFEGPENTLIAARNAVNNGADAIEIDLDFSKDGVPVIFHDDDVDRVTDHKGRLDSYTYNEILKFNAAAQHSYIINKQGKQGIDFEKIPTLHEMVELCIQKNILINLDVKSNARLTVAALKKVLIKYPNITNFMVVTSFFPHILYQIRKECPEFTVGIIWRYYFLSRTMTGERKHTWLLKYLVMSFLDKMIELSMDTWLPDFLGVSLLSLHKNHLSERYVKQLRGDGYEVMTWTVNNIVDKEYFLKNLKVSIITDSILDCKDCSEQTN